MGNNMRKHLNSAEGQDFWKAAKLQRIVDEQQALLKQMQEAIQQQEQNIQYFQRVSLNLLKQAGGSATIQDADFWQTEGRIMMQQDIEHHQFMLTIQPLSEGVQAPQAEN